MGVEITTAAREFPLPTLRRMVSGHRWHLACEFSNWIEAAFR